jgi:hypothetical protein
MDIKVISRATLLVLVSAVLLAGCSSETPPAAFDDCADESLPTLAVKARVTQNAYRPGDVATFKVLVVRAVQTDEHGEGARQELGPVEEAEVTIGATVKDVTLGAGGTTDEDGRATVKMVLQRYVPAGLADVIASATSETVDAHCVPNESGHIEKPDLFRVIR